MITNMDYLIQRYAEAQEKMQQCSTTCKYSFQYWRGAMESYRDLLAIAFEGWDAPGTTGYYVSVEGLSYDAALQRIGSKDVDWEIEDEWLDRGYSAEVQ